MQDMNQIMKGKIAQAVEKALAGSRKVKITFKRDGFVGIPFLLGMLNSEIISLNESDHVVLMAVSQSRSWDGDRNRTVLVTLTEKFDQEWFTSRLHRELEKIEFVNTK